MSEGELLRRIRERMERAPLASVDDIILEMKRDWPFDHRDISDDQELLILEPCIMDPATRRWFLRWLGEVPH